VLKKQIEKLDIKILTNATVKEFVGKREVSHALITNGEMIETDVVLISAGIRPRLDLVKKDNFEINKCLVVNQYMETSIPNTYAAGDVIEYNHQSWGIIPAALEQAAVAAKSILDIKEDGYKPTIPSNTLKIMDFDLVSIGTTTMESEDDECKVFSAKNDEKGIFKKFVLKNGVLIGAILLGTKEDSSFIKKYINKEVHVEEIEKRLIIK
ncbi:MAG: FAD-dependent oxidoreductase, partial [Promethearchaeota archaeon]